MLARLISGIVGLVAEDDEEYQSACESGSPRAQLLQQEPQDGGHLTGGGGGGSRRNSNAGAPSHRRQSSSWQGEAEALAEAAVAADDGGPGREAEQQQLEQQQPGEGGERAEPLQEEEGGGGSGRWSILGGVPFLPAIVQLLSPKAADAEGEQLDDEDDEEQRWQRGASEQQQQGPGPTPASPSGASSRFPGTSGGGAGAGGAEDDADLEETTTPPAPLLASFPLAPRSHQQQQQPPPPPRLQPLPETSEASGLLTEDHLRALAAAVPARYRQARWTLLYSTARDGTSLPTLLRNARGRAPSVLVVRDFDRHVFGAYCSEAWRLDTRYFGTGESFVFQLAPRQHAWYWWWRRMAKDRNDYFQWGSSEAIAVGGAGGYALWLDADLTSGISRNSTTFGNDSLSGREEFSVGAVELWGLS